MNKHHFNKSTSGQRSSHQPSIEDLDDFASQLAHFQQTHKDQEKRDPFDSYVLYVQGLFYKDEEHFREQFTNGYASLLDVLKK